jgi:hypothetical protein
MNAVRLPVGQRERLFAGKTYQHKGLQEINCMTLYGLCIIRVEGHRDFLDEGTGLAVFNGACRGNP